MSNSSDGANCGRTDCPCKQETLNSSEESHSTPNSSDAESNEKDSDDVDSIGANNNGGDSAETIPNGGDGDKADCDGARSDGGESHEAYSGGGDSEEANCDRGDTEESYSGGEDSNQAESDGGDSDGGDSDRGHSDGGESYSADSDGRESDETDCNGGCSDEPASSGGHSDEAESNGEDSDEVNSDGGASHEVDSDGGDSSEGDSIQSDCNEGDSTGVGSKEEDPIEANTIERGTINSDSTEKDPIEVDSNEGGSEESSEWNSVEVESSGGHSVEVGRTEKDSNKADSSETDSTEAGIIEGALNESEFKDAEWINVKDFSERIVGKDGNYYDCDVCHGVGTLLCCDSCPSTFHLGCLEPPLKSAPVGFWECQKCSALDKLSASKRSKAPSALGKKQLNESSYVPVGPKSSSSAVGQKFPATSSHSLDKLVGAGDVLEKLSTVDACSGDRGNSVINISDEEGNQSGSNMGEIKVYKRSMWKKNIRMEEGVNLEKSSVAASDLIYEDHQDKPVHYPVEINEKLLEQGDAVLACEEMNERPYLGSLDVILQHKLSIPRDVTQASANGHSFSQNSELRDPQLPAYLNHDDSKVRKERLAYLRARQKARISKMIKVGDPAPSSGPFRSEGLPQLHGFSGPSKNYSSMDPIPAIPLRMLRPEDAAGEGTYQSSEKTDDHKEKFDGCRNSLENLSVKSHKKRSNYNLEGFGIQFPGFPSFEASNPLCSTTVGGKRQKTDVFEFPSPLQGFSPIPQPRDGYPSRTSTSDFFSGFPMASTGYNSLRMMDMEESWSSRELDSLWVGVRRHGHGNWLQMLTDRSLFFSKGKTAEALAEKWEQERATHFGVQIATIYNPTKGKRKMIDIDLNTVPSDEGLQPSESFGKEEGEEPKLLVGGHIGIPVVKAGGGAASSGRNQMQMQEAGGPGAGGRGMKLPEIVEISSESEVEAAAGAAEEIDSEATISDLSF